MMVGTADRPSKMHFGSRDPGESYKRGKNEERRGEKYKPVREEISEHANESSGRQAPGRLKALIAPKPLGKGNLADEAQAYGRNSRPDQWAHAPLQHHSREDNGERGPKPHRQCAEPYAN